MSIISASPNLSLQNCKPGDIITVNPRVQEMIRDPLVQRTIKNAQSIISPINPILTADLIDMGAQYEVFVDIPGVSKDELDVNITEGVLTISAERLRSYDHSDVWGTRVSERAHGKVKRSITLPANAHLDTSCASLEHGVLKIVIPKTQPIASKLLTL